MILDSSAVIAVLAGDPERAAFEDAILDAPSIRIGAPTYVEISIVLQREHAEAAIIFDRWLAAISAEIVAFERRHAEVARDAFARYGRRSGHTARLNFGDCLTYAIAVTADEPLLFKGDGFAQTDVIPAVASR